MIQAAMSIIPLLLLLLGTQPHDGAAPKADAKPSQRQAIHVTATLVSEKDGLVPGETAWLGLDLKIDQGWHIYWPGENDTGPAPTLQITAPDGFKAGQTVWPAPKRYLATGPGGGILDHIYESRVLLLIPVTVPTDAKPSAAEFSIKAKWIVCADVCLPGDGTSSLTIPVVAPGAKPKSTPQAALFEATRERVPVHLKKESGVTARVDHRTFIVESPGAASLSFYPLEGSAAMPNLAKEGESKDGKLAIKLEPDSPKSHVKGVLEVIRKGSKQPSFFSVDLEVPQD